MGFHFNPLKAITRAVGIHDSARPAIQTALDVVFPVHFIANTLATKGLEAGNRLFQPKPSVRQSGTPYGPVQNPLNFTYQAPSYQAPYYGGGGSALDFGYNTPTYGGSPWGYSTGSEIYSTTQYPVSSVARDRPWEDLAGTLGAVLPFFL